MRRLVAVRRPRPCRDIAARGARRRGDRRRVEAPAAGSPARARREARDARVPNAGGVRQLSHEPWRGERVSASSNMFMSFDRDILALYIRGNDSGGRCLRTGPERHARRGHDDARPSVRAGYLWRAERRALPVRHGRAGPHGCRRQLVGDTRAIGVRVGAGRRRLARVRIARHEHDIPVARADRNGESRARRPRRPRRRPPLRPHRGPAAPTTAAPTAAPTTAAPTTAAPTAAVSTTPLPTRSAVAVASPIRNVGAPAPAGGNNDFLLTAGLVGLGVLIGIVIMAARRPRRSIRRIP